MAVPRQLPNAITIVRILCAPVFLWMLLADDGADGHGGVLCGSCVDGWTGGFNQLCTKCPDTSGATTQSTTLAPKTQ